eukprot:773857-Amphidinium_carterae.1
MSALCLSLGKGVSAKVRRRVKRRLRQDEMVRVCVSALNRLAGYQTPLLSEAEFLHDELSLASMRQVQSAISAGDLEAGMNPHEVFCALQGGMGRVASDYVSEATPLVSWPSTGSAQGSCACSREDATK